MFQKIDWPVFYRQDKEFYAMMDTYKVKKALKAYSRTRILHSLQLCTLCYWDICIMQ